MKTVTVNGQHQVGINHGSESDALCAETAQIAVRLLYGHVENATVTDGRSGFRVTKSMTRRLTAEEEHDAGID